VHSTKTSTMIPTISNIITTEPTNIHNFDIRTNIENEDILVCFWMIILFKAINYVSLHFINIERAFLW